MSNYLDTIPQAVATIVSASYDAALARAGGAANKERDDLENRIIDLADKLARTLAKALMDAESGKPEGEKP